MAQLTWYAKNAGNWDAANAWNDQADGLGTDRTNPQNDVNNTYICDLNNKAINVNCAISVDQIKTGVTNAGGTLAIPNSTAATITVATATTGLYSNSATTMVTWGTGTCSLTVNGDVQNAGSATSSNSLFVIGTSRMVFLNGTATASSGTVAYVGSAGAITITKAGGTAVSCTGTGFVVQMDGGSGALVITGNVVSSSSGIYCVVNEIGRAHV